MQDVDLPILILFSKNKIRKIDNYSKFCIIFAAWNISTTTMNVEFDDKALEELYLLGETNGKKYKKSLL